MDQIFCLAASISPPMLPVVSRQNTTSTFGFFFAGGLVSSFLSAARAGSPRHSPATASTTAVPRSIERIMRGPFRKRFRGTLLTNFLDEAEAVEDCRGAGFQPARQEAGWKPAPRRLTAWRRPAP